MEGVSLGNIDFKFIESLKETEGQIPIAFPLNTCKVNRNMAVDENYLYVWIASIEKWKRIILSDWTLLNDVSTV